MQLRVSQYIQKFADWNHHKHMAGFIHTKVNAKGIKWFQVFPKNRSKEIGYVVGCFTLHIFLNLSNTDQLKLYMHALGCPNIHKSLLIGTITSIWLPLYIRKSMQKESRVLRPYFSVATIFCIYKGNSGKIQRKICHRTIIALISWTP